jgi:hypothetical protein
MFTVRKKKEVRKKNREGRVVFEERVIIEKSGAREEN